MRAYHNSRLSEYRKPFGAINTGGTVSLSIDLFEESGAEIVLRTWVDGEGEAFYPMKKNPMDDRVRYSCELKCEEAALYWYSFRIDRADGTCMYYGAKQGSTGGEGIMYFGNPPSFQITCHKERKLPEWYRNAVVYQIFPDRFCKLDYKGNKQLNDWDDNKSLTRHSFYGGNLKGAMSKLEYLKDLGITGIYFTPLVTSTENHKYNISDYEHIDPDFGDNEYFRKLVEKAHSLGIKVMIDAVFNHSGRGFFAWQDVVKNGKNSKYYDWYFVKKDNFSFDGNTKDGRYYSFAFVDEMPKLDTSNPEVMDYFTKVCKDWIEMWNIDGIRFDVGNEISHAFIKKLHRELKAVKPDLFLLGEIWMDSTPYLLGDEYDSVMNYPFMQSLSNFFVDETLSSDDFMYMMNYCYSLYMKQVNQVVFNFLDSHDVDRAITRCGSYDKLIQQLSVLVTMPGSPCIYYGTEIALEGKNDPDNRRPMPWKDIENKVYDKTISTVKSLISLRKQHKACESQNIPWHSEDGRFIKYEKHSADEVLKVYINAGNSPLDVTINNEQVLFSHLYDRSCLQKGGVIITKLL